MDTTACDISDLDPQQREAAEKLVGRPLGEFQKVAIRGLAGGDDVVIRFFGRRQEEVPQATSSGWDIPACFRVLTDLSQQELADFDAVVSEPLQLARTS